MRKEDLIIPVSFGVAIGASSPSYAPLLDRIVCGVFFAILAGIGCLFGYYIDKYEKKEKK